MEGSDTTSFEFQNMLVMRIKTRPASISPTFPWDFPHRRSRSRFSLLGNQAGWRAGLSLSGTRPRCDGMRFGVQAQSDLVASLVTGTAAIKVDSMIRYVTIIPDVKSLDRLLIKVVNSQRYAGRCS